MANNDEALPQKSERQFHDVVFFVNRVSRALYLRGAQNLVARAHTKLNINEVRELKKILQEYEDNYKDGMGPLTVSMEGEFR